MKSTKDKQAFYNLIRLQIIKNKRFLELLIFLQLLTSIGYSQTTKQVTVWYDAYTKKLVSAKYSVLSSNFDVKHGPFKEYARTGAITHEGNYNQGMKIGKWIYRQDNNLLSGVENYNSKGQYHGLYINYNLWGTGKLMEGSFENGKKIGLWKQWWGTMEEPNNLAWEGFYVDDIENGLFKGYYRNGKLEKTGNLKLAKMDGIWKFYSEKGHLNLQGSYKEGVYNGMFIFYDENGSGDKITEGKYLNGNRIGEWTIYYDKDWKETTNKLNIEFFRKVKYNDAGDLDGKVTDYYKTGEKQFEGYILPGDITDGDCLFFHKNGNLKSEGRYDKGKMIGFWKNYYESGNKYSEGNFKDGKKDGEWIDYYESGKIGLKEIYKSNGNHLGLYYDETGHLYGIHPYEGKELDSIGIQEEEIKQLLRYLSTEISSEKPFQFKYDLMENQDAMVLFYQIERNTSIDQTKLRLVKETYDKYSMSSNKDDKYKLGKSITENLYSLSKK